MFDNIEYDILGRLIFQFEPISKTRYEYKYLANGRIVLITNEKNKTNFKTIKHQKLINDVYKDYEIEEYGEKYNIKKRYSDNGEEIFFEQTNLTTGKIHTKNTLWKNNTPRLWSTEYDGNKSIGFYIEKNKLTGLTKNIEI